MALDADQHTVAIVALGAVLGPGIALVGWLLARMITQVDKKLDRNAEVIGQHGERIAKVEARVETHDLRLGDMARMRVKP